MKLTVSIDDEVFQRAQKRAEALGTSVEQLLCAYLDELAAETSRSETDYHADTAEFIRLSTPPRGNSRGWKFNREEIHER